jgi:hypothetical protein
MSQSGGMPNLTHLPKRTPADYALRSMASSPQPGGAEQPVLVPLLRWSSSAQAALPAVLGSQIRALGRAPRQGLQCNRTAWATCEDDLVPGHVVPLEAEPAGWTWQQSPGRRASSVGGTGPGSRRPQRAAGRRAWCQRGQHRQASPCAGGAAAGIDPWLLQPVLAILVSMLDQRQGRHLLVLE